jgi:hypothetical protein
MRLVAGAERCRMLFVFHHTVIYTDGTPKGSA